MSAARCVRGVCRGRVQGVGFRMTLAREARRLGVRGWVRNRDDGAVEFLAAGAEDAVAQLLGWARNGPPGARVDELIADELSEDCPDVRSADDFSVVR